MITMGRLLGSCVLLACATPTLAAQAPDGAALYREHCKECHGAAGRPPKTARDKYKDIKALNAELLGPRSDDSLLAVVQRGAKDGKEMKPLKDKLTPEEMAAVVKYVRTRFGGSGESDQ